MGPAERERAMKTLELKAGFYWTGIVDEKLRVFDIIMETEFGTTYNSYLMKTGGKTILFETAKEKFFGEYLEKLKELTEVEHIDYLVVNHTEPDHAGSISHLLELNPSVQVIATECAIGFLKELVNRDFCAVAVTDGGSMKIGEKTLRFFAVPNLHWPDTMYTYIEEDGILITCDSFGSHYAFPGVLRSKVEASADYWKAARYYFDAIIGPYKPFMREALARVRELPVSLLCPGHGPVLDTGIEEMFETYAAWSAAPVLKERPVVVIPYVSAYGYTGLLAEQIGKGILESGDIEVRLYDMVEADRSRVQAELLEADGLLFGTPTIVGEALKPIWELCISMFPVTHGGKPASAFGSYGWSGEGVPHILERLRELRMKVEDEGLRVRFKPDEADLLDAREFGFRFGTRVRKEWDTGSASAAQQSAFSGASAEKAKKNGRCRLVKCVVCGAIFDSSLDICPVCGVGRENFVPVDEKETGFRKDTENRYVILGNGIAGLSAARAVRERDKTGSIVLVSEEPWDTYNRPMLTKAGFSGLSAEAIAVEPENWYAENQIERRLGRKVSAINKEEKKVQLSDGAELSYTKLIYALGAECKIPPVPGTDKRGVAVIRRIADIEKIGSLLPGVKHAVVIGGGILGLEAAWALKRSGCSVTVLELSPRLLGRQLDGTAAELLKTICQRNGITVRTGVQASLIEGDGQVTGVRIGNEEAVPAELVILSAGIRPNADLAEAAGIRTDRAVAVNEHMETNVPDIYACGDCAGYGERNLGLWPEAEAQGRIAGANAAGERLSYEPVEPAVMFHGMNTELFAVGDNGTEDDGGRYKTLEIKDPARGQYRKYTFLNGRLSGVILLGDTADMAGAVKAVEEGTKFGELFNTLR